MEMRGPFDNDMFASRLNFKIPNYVSRKKHSGASFTNAFLMTPEHHYFHVFPPFSLIASCLQKVEQKRLGNWDVQKDLFYISSFAPTVDLSLKLLTFKTIMLIALVTAERV